MKLYLVWESSRGGKDLVVIYNDIRRAKAFCKGYNDEAKTRGIKRRCYIVEYELKEDYSASIYEHKEIKED